MVQDLSYNLCESLVENIDGVAGVGKNTPVPPQPITYLTQWQIVGNSEVHGQEIWSCGEYNSTDGKYHIFIQPLGGSIADIALTEPLRKVNDVADSIEFPSDTEGKALVTRNIYNDTLINGNWYIAGSGIVASRYWNTMISLTDVATNVIAEGFTQQAYNQLKNYSYGIGANTYSSGQLVVVGLYDSSFINEGALTQDFYDYISNKDIQFILAAPTTELVDAPQIEEADSYTCEISQGGKAVSWSSFSTD